MATLKKASLHSIHRHSWVSLLVCWMIWVLNAYDRGIVLQLFSHRPQPLIVQSQR